MTTEQIITHHIQSLEIQNRGYRKQLEAETSDLLCIGLTRSIAENDVILGVLRQAVSFMDTQIGKSVKYSQYGLDTLRNRKASANMIGTVKRTQKDTYLIKWEHRLKPQYIHKSFIEIINP